MKHVERNEEEEEKRRKEQLQISQICTYPPHKQTAESAKRSDEAIQRFTSNKPPDGSTGQGWGWATLPSNLALMPNILDRLRLKTQNSTGSPHSYLNFFFAADSSRLVQLFGSSSGLAPTPERLALIRNAGTRGAPGPLGNKGPHGPVGNWAEWSPGEC